MIEHKKILNFKELIEYTGLSSSLLYKATMQKTIPHFKSGTHGKLYFKAEEINAWLLQKRIVSLEDLSIVNPENATI